MFYMHYEQMKLCYLCNPFIAEMQWWNEHTVADGQIIVKKGVLFYYQFLLPLKKCFLLPVNVKLHFKYLC